MADLFELFTVYDGMLAALGPAFALGRVDFSQNVAKIRSRYEVGLPGKTGKAGTLRELLEGEKASGIHKGGRLADPSAANSVMWIRRTFALIVTSVEILAAGEPD